MSERYGFVCYGCFSDSEKLAHPTAAALPTECVRCGEFAYGSFIPEPCRAGLCQAHATAHSGDCEVRRLLTENTRLVQECERLRLDAAAAETRAVTLQIDNEHLREVVGRRPN